MSISFISATNSDSTSTFDHTVAAGSDRALVVLTYGFTGSNVPTGITYNSVAMTKIVEGPSVNYKMSAWVLVAPSTGTNSVVISGTGTFGSLVMDYTGVSQSAPCPENQQNSQTIQNYSPSLTTTIDNSWLIGGGSNDGSNSSAGANTIERTTVVGTRIGGDSNGARTPAGAQSLNWTSSSSCTWSGCMVSLAPSTGGAATVVPSSNLLTLNAG